LISTYNQVWKDFEGKTTSTRTNEQLLQSLSVC